VIISGDSDFSPLVSKLRENDKIVIGVGVKNSTSDLLIANCDEFIFYDDLVPREAAGAARKTAARAAPGQPKERAPKGPRPSRRFRQEKRGGTRQEGLELMLETIEALVAERGGDEKIWSSMVKQALKRRKPGFNESYYGFRSFNGMLEEAEHRGNLKLERDEKVRQLPHPARFRRLTHAAAVTGAGSRVRARRLRNWWTRDALIVAAAADRADRPHVLDRLPVRQAGAAQPPGHGDGGPGWCLREVRGSISRAPREVRRDARAGADSRSRPKISRCCAMDESMWHSSRAASACRCRRWTMRRPWCRWVPSTTNRCGSSSPPTDPRSTGSRSSLARGWPVGPDGSGTRALALKLLSEGGAVEGGTRFLPIAGEEALTALEAHEVEVIFQVAGVEAPVVAALLRRRDLRQMSLAHAVAFAKRNAYLSVLTVPRGVVSIAEDLPSRDVTMVATTANLLAQSEVHRRSCTCCSTPRPRSTARRRISRRRARSECPRTGHAGRARGGAVLQIGQAVPAQLSAVLGRQSRRPHAHPPDTRLRRASPCLQDRAVAVHLRLKSRIFQWYEQLTEVEIEISREGDRPLAAPYLARLDANRGGDQVGPVCRAGCASRRICCERNRHGPRTAARDRQGAAGRHAKRWRRRQSKPKRRSLERPRGLA
jgi:hypothetical protein